jgi:hypothetical protein
LKQPRKSINTSKHIKVSLNNKTPTNETQHEKTKTSDNKTNVYIRLDEPKSVACFRCNKELWKSFKKQIRAQGMSICHVLEAMIYGWLHGNVYISNSIKPIKIENLIVERAVKRVRRYGVEPESVAECELSSKRWYCCLFDEHISVESLPLSDCFKCPNSGCRDYVLKLKTRGE